MIQNERENEAGCERCNGLEHTNSSLHKLNSEILQSSLKVGLDFIEQKSLAKIRKFWQYFWFVCFILISFFLLHEKANASDYPCSRAHLTYSIPTTRVNGAPLTIDELDYYEIKVIDQETGETDFYILDQYNVVDVDGPVNERVYTTKENQNFPLRLGMQCFSIRVVDTEGLKSVWSEITESQCKRLCSFNTFELKIKLGITDNN